MRERETCRDPCHVHHVLAPVPKSCPASMYIWGFGICFGEHIHMYTYMINTHTRMCICTPTYTQMYICKVFWRRSMAFVFFLGIYCSSHAWKETTCITSRTDICAVKYIDICTCMCSHICIHICTCFYI